MALLLRLPAAEGDQSPAALLLASEPESGTWWEEKVGELIVTVLGQLRAGFG